MPLVIPFPDGATGYQYDQANPVGNQPFDQPQPNQPPQNMFAPASNAQLAANAAPAAAPMLGEFNPPETTVTADPGRTIQVIRGGQESYYKLDETGTYHETPESLQNRIVQDALRNGTGHGGVPNAITTDLIKSSLLEKQKPNMLTAIQGLLDRGAIDETQAALSQAQLDNGINPFETILGHTRLQAHEDLKRQTDAIQVDIDASKDKIKQIDTALGNLSTHNPANAPRVEGLNRQLQIEQEKLSTAREKLKGVLSGTDVAGSKTVKPAAPAAGKPAPGTPATSTTGPSAAAGVPSESIVSKIKASGGDDVFAHRVAMTTAAAQQQGRPLKPEEVFDLVGGDKNKARALAKILGLKF